ncbi:MAG: hypothetical protein J0H74_10085 [Chitinophagaceae bacterium]|nr:hypothetical protein [Chitinophagaceae bacterium]
MPVKLSNFYYYIYHHFSVLFWPVLAATFIVAFLQLKDQTYLRNDLAPKGIVSLELGHTRAVDSAIIASWKQDTVNRLAADPCREKPPVINRLHRAHTDVYMDFIFILLYTTLGVIIITALQTRIGKAARPISNILLALMILAGICDVIEDLGMLTWLDDAVNPIPAGVIRAMALTKFSILGFILFIYLPYTLIMKDGGLQWLSAYIRTKTLQLFRYRVIILGVLIFSLPIWVMDQGQDLLVNSNSSDTGILLFVGIVLMTAFLNWWLAKLFFEKEYKGPVCRMTEPIIPDSAQEASEKKVSRYLGVITILIPATAILNALQVLRIPFPLDIFPPTIWLAAILGIFFVLIRFDIAAGIYRQLTTRLGKTAAQIVTISTCILLGLVLPCLIRYLFLGRQSNAPGSLFWLFFHLLLLATAFWIFVSTRSYVFSADSWWCRKIGWPIILCSGALAVLFTLFNIFPLTVLKLNINYLTLPVLLSGIIFYILLATLLIRVSLWLKINLVLFIVVTDLILAISVPNDYHSVRLKPQPQPSPSLSLNDYFHSWLLHRKDEILNAPGEYPIFLVNTYGGGIKAAAFTNMTLSYLDSTLIQNSKNHKSFEHYVFSISGASGGTVGAAVQCAYRARYLDSPGAYSLDHFRTFYGHDFLTPVLGNMLGRDIWASAAGYPLWRDRSAIQEGLWEGFGHSSLDISLDQDFNAIWQDTSATCRAGFEVPLLFSNTLNVDDGLKGIMAPVGLSHTDFPGTIFIQERIAALNTQRKKEKDPPMCMTLMTGAFLSARFPFISPSGKIGPGYHFMDGGAKDNSGASTSEAIFISLARQGCRRSDKDTLFTTLMKKVRFYFVSITNSPYYNPDTRQMVSNRFEPISPLVGIINSGINGNAQAADNTLQVRYNSDSTQFPGIRSDYSAVWITATCVKDGKGRFYSPVLPLGWQISAPSLERMRNTFEQDMIQSYNKEGLRKILKIMNAF